MIIDCNVLFGKWKYSNQDYPVEKVVSLLKMHSIDRALVASTKGILYDDESANDETLSVTKNLKDLIPVGTVNLNRYLDVEKEVAKRKKQGFKAFRLFSEYQGIDFDGIRFNNFMNILEKFNMPLIIRGTDFNLKSYVDKIALSTYKYNIPIIILDVSGYSLAEMIEAAKYNSNIYFSTRLFTTMQSIELFCEEVGKDRLVMGSGIPFYYGHQSLYRIKTSCIDEKSKEDILSGNLLRILGGSL